MKKLKRGKKSGLVYVTTQDIRSWKPCCDPNKYIQDNWKGTALAALIHENLTFADILWLVLRPEICSEKLMRLFAVSCYRDTLNWAKNPDPRSIEAANVGERYALGLATEKERDDAYAYAYTDFALAWDATDTESASASVAACAAATDIAHAARYAAKSATYAAVWSTAESAVYAARYTDAQERYKHKLIEMLIIEGQQYVQLKKEKPNV